MSYLAFVLPPDLSGFLLSFVQGLFIFFVVGSFVAAAIYTVRQVVHGTLIDSGNSPLSLRMQPPATGWLFIVCVLGLIYLQSIYFPMLVLLGTAAVLVQNRRTADAQFGMTRLPFTRAFAYGLIVFGAVMLVETPLAELSDRALEWCHLPHPEQGAVEAFRLLDSTTVIVVFMVQAVLFNPLLEEIFFRGFLLTFLKNYTTPWLAVILSGGVFAFAHLNLGAAIPLWFLGIVLGVAYEHTGSLLVPAIIHGCFNLATGLNLLLERGSSS